jgi:hypothetical protein
VDVLILSDVAEFCHYFRRHRHVTRGEEVLERIGSVGTDGCVRTRHGETDESAGVGDDGSESPVAHRSSSPAVSTAVASPS